MGRSGLSARLLPTNGYPVVFGERHVGNDRPTVLVYGHYDVQPVDPLDAWDSPPFEPVVRDGRIWGRGSATTRASTWPNCWRCERTSTSSASYRSTSKSCWRAKRRAPATPGGVRRSQRGDLARRSGLHVGRADPRERSANRGPGRARDPVRRIARAWSQYRCALRQPWRRRPNPAWTLVDVLHSMRGPDGRVAIAGFYDDVRPIGQLERAALAGLPVDVEAFLRGYELHALPPPDERSFFERLMLQPTLNISGITSGYAGQGMKTIIPSTATVKLDMRLVADQDPEHVLRCLTEHVQARAPGVEVVRIGAMEPSRTALDHPYVAAISAAVAQAHDGQPPLLVPALGGSFPDYVFTRILGLPSLLVPYANPDQRNHAPNENFAIDRFVRGIKTFAAVLEGAWRRSKAWRNEGSAHVKLFVRTVGEPSLPRTAVLVHGIARAAGSWWRVAEALVERGYYCLAPDLRGHGQSPSRSASPT